MSTAYETTVDTLREVGERLAHDVPSSLASVRVPSGWIPSGVSSVLPDDLVDRVTSGGRPSRRTPLLVVGGVVVAILAVVWFVRRQRSTDAETRLSVANGARSAGAA